MSREASHLRPRWCFLDRTWLCWHLDGSAKETPSPSLIHTKYLSNPRLAISLPTDHSGIGETDPHEDRRGQEFSGHFPKWFPSPPTAGWSISSNIHHWNEAALLQGDLPKSAAPSIWTRLSPGDSKFSGLSTLRLHKVINHPASSPTCA